MSDYPDDWQLISSECKRLANYKCKNCNKYFGKLNSFMLDAHHKRSISNGGSSDQTNLECLCKSCHKLKHPHLVRNITKTKHKRRVSYNSRSRSKYK